MIENHERLRGIAVGELNAGSIVWSEIMIILDEENDIQGVSQWYVQRFTELPTKFSASLIYAGFNISTFNFS